MFFCFFACFFLLALLFCVCSIFSASPPSFPCWLFLSIFLSVVFALFAFSLVRFCLVRFFPLARSRLPSVFSFLSFPLARGGSLFSLSLFFLARFASWLSLVLAPRSRAWARRAHRVHAMRVYRCSVNYEKLYSSHLFCQGFGANFLKKSLENYHDLPILIPVLSFQYHEIPEKPAFFVGFGKYLAKLR